VSLAIGAQDKTTTELAQMSLLTSVLGVTMKNYTRSDEIRK